MSFYKLVLRYNGFGYQGWQKQAHSENTIQGQLDFALRKISKSDKVHSIGSGRTDSGVHALEQVARVDIDLEIAPESLLKALNSHLPSSIECLKCDLSDEGFNPVFDAKEKTYRYIFSTTGRRNPHLEQLVYFSNMQLDEKLMSEACATYIGKHDFSDFYTTGTEVSSTVREIYSCSIKKIENRDFFSDLLNEYYQFEVTGNGFLKQMVRLMVGTLWNVGQSKVTIEQLQQKLKSPNGSKLAAVAPPQGLYLSSVKY
ncbi:tRNA pseudouridine(38-40) synthase TruA [Halobacteriovorax sp. HLS]|uniref:tRNA pseudouridine(38-40) synthase TruA n=1 Tax=Halobacteriovorax sp. HLS TaxID=2234000 RepID=UPI0013E2A250|nr:tRNA pseudouridine(38-40) synthase TruA [Halobacteriovorax sp. HLS]